MGMQKRDKTNDPLLQEQTLPRQPASILKTLMLGSQTGALYAADDDQSRRQYMTVMILTTMWITGLAFTTPVLVGWLVSYFDLESVLIFLCMDGIIGTGWWLARRGRWRLGSYIAPAVMFALGVYGTYWGGLSTTFVLFYAVTILLVSMLQVGKAQWLASALSAIRMRRIC